MFVYRRLRSAAWHDMFRRVGISLLFSQSRFWSRAVERHATRGVLKKPPGYNM